MDDSPAAPAVTAAKARLEEEKEGARIDRYKLLQKIGEGGFGTVWMAEQLEPVSRRVALKIIKVGMDTREVIARFEAERQALAMMDHPHIAQVFDAGETDKGRPFFVMELVKGIPITHFCDEQELGTRARLALFEDVCGAINHAHQKGVIHRDIKPSNVMITLHGETPVVKVIDFGIAKATQGKLTEKTLFTRFEQFIGTPVYMSPEQAAMSGLDVDTRSDIYALGILLYELLTGKPPFDTETLAAAGYDEMRRIIREVDPPKPSSRISTMVGEERTTVARARHSEPGEVGRLVEPDLDWIVMKAIDKDRGRRYETAGSLARDIRRFLTDQTVSATPPSAGYRFQKFARRHRTFLRVASSIALVLVLGTVVSTWQAVRATRERQRADRETEMAEQNLFYAQMHLAQQAWRQHRGLRQMRELLARWLPKNGAPDRRGWEWFYLNALPQKNMRILTGQEAAEGPCTVAWNLPTNRLAEGTADGVIRIWDPGGAQPVLVLRAPAPEVPYSGSRWLAFNPDGSRLAAGCRDGTVHVWDISTGQELKVFRGLQTSILTVAFSSDGARLAAWAKNGAIAIWESETGRMTAEFTHAWGRYRRRLES